MKFSFSPKNWKGYSWNDFCCTANEIGFSGIEIHDIDDCIYCEKNGPLNPDKVSTSKRKLINMGLSISSVDFFGSFSEYDKICKCIYNAKRLGSSYIRISDGEVHDNTDEFISETIEQLNPLVKEAEKNGIIILIETTGVFADTSKLLKVLNSFACDNLAADWNMHDTYFFADESAEQTITNLGAYVKLVHISDATKIDGKVKYTLIGDGELPIADMMNSLRSVNYNGFISLEWDPDRIEGINELEIIFPHFINYMKRFDAINKKKSNLYHNKAHTGNFIWKKDSLIDYTFSQMLDRVVEEFPDQYAFKYTTLDYTRTYTEFRDDVDTCARALISLGVKPGDHIAVWASNVPQWYITFWATTKIGAVLVTMNTAYKIHEAEYLLKQSDTHTLVMTEGSKDSSYSSIISELCPELDNHTAGEPLHSKRLPFLRNVITVGYKKSGCLEWKEAISRSSRVPVEEVYRLAANVDKNEVCNMQYTSGTTGFPKGVMLTHYNIVNNGKCIGDRMDLSTADRMMIQVPMFHCFGMVLAMTASMTHGATLLPLPYFSPKPALACINNEHITAFHGVPTMFIALLEHPDFPNTDFSYMRTGIMAGSPCPVSIMQDVVNKMHMTEITIVYGQTESSPGCTMSSTTDSLETRVATVGGPLPEIECKIVDPETGLDCPDNVTGEFVARGYNLMKGYYKMPHATACAIDKDGWLHTGDLACRTPEGNYRITGRLKDMIIRGGENIYPKEIEEFIYTHPKVKDVQVIGVPDEQYGEEIMACVVLKDNEEMTEDELKTYIRDHMAKHKVPRYVDFVKEFPMNVAGKILKYKMREDAIKKLKLQKANDIVTA